MEKEGRETQSVVCLGHSHTAVLCTCRHHGLFLYTIREKKEREGEEGEVGRGRRGREREGEGGRGRRGRERERER